MRVILVKEIYQNAIFPPTCLQALQIFEGNFQSHMNTSELVQAQTAKMRLLSFEVIVYKSRGELFLLLFLKGHRGRKGIFDSFSKMLFKQSVYKDKNSQKI